ncbi:MAG: STAS domain-containing protein, partial [Mycobacteriaceae bacterium]|nr:STAS domain-containing protein [Mycobacteriaceae bacterium]
MAQINGLTNFGSFARLAFPTTISGRPIRVKSMTAVHTQAAEELHSTSVIDCGNALMTAQVYSWLTVVTISGEIDATNAAELAHHMVGVVPDDGAVIVDMADTDFIGVDGLRALFAMNVECVRTDTRWAVIGSHA